MKIKVLHVVLSMETGGLENGIVNLTNQSNQNNFVVDILCLRERGELADRIQNSLSRVIFDGNNDPSLVVAVKKIIKACKENGYHIIHSHGFTTMLASYIAKLFLDKTFIINGEHGTLYSDTAKQRFIQRFLFKHMDLNLTVSKDLKNDIHKRFSLTKDNFLPIINGVDTEKFSPQDNKYSRELLNIPKDALVIGSVGRLVSGKNYPNLIRSFAKIPSKSKPIVLLLVGDGPERAHLESLCQKLNITERVHFSGRRDDVPVTVHAMDLFVLPSLSEGLSNTLLEAMSSGKPVIACNVGGNPEIIIDGHTGYLYHPDSDTELTKILDDLSSDTQKIETLSAQARTHIVANYSLKNMVDNYEKAYVDAYKGNTVNSTFDLN